MPPAAVVSAKYLVSYTVGGTAVAKRDSLVGAGPLKVQLEHYFAKVLPATDVPALGGGELSIDLRKIEFVAVGSTEFGRSGRRRLWRAGSALVYISRSFDPSSPSIGRHRRARFDAGRGHR